MKKCVSTLLVLFTVLTLFSCESQDSETITFQSTDNRLKVLVSGQRYSSLDPWTMTVQQVLSDSILAEAKVDVFFESPTTENIIANWRNSNHLVLTFVEQDGNTKIMPVVIEH